MSSIEEYKDHLKAFENFIGIIFNNKEFLFRCLIHDSFVYENERVRFSNERLEFLGDSVLGLVVSDLLYSRYPDWSEGDLALFKSRLVSADSLAEIAKEMDLGRFLFLGKGEESSGGRQRISILADSLEAFLGALYLDQGFESVYDMIGELFKDSFNLESPPKDFKSYLQEYSQKVFKLLPVYVIIGEEGPPHRKIFKVRVNIGESADGYGEGSSKKEAEQNAASDLLGKLPEDSFHNGNS